MDKYPTAIAPILHSLAQSAPQQASDLRARGVPTWWKGLEATLALLGGLADDIRDRMEEDEMEGKGKSIELGWVFESVIPGLLDQSGELLNLFSCFAVAVEDSRFGKGFTRRKA